MQRNLILALLLLAALGAAWALWPRPRPLELSGTVLKNPRPAPEFRLESASGPVTLADFRGKVVLVFFGYAHCPDVCPLTLNHLAHLYRELGEPEQLQVVAISIDPERDTPEAMDRYAKMFHPSFVGLSGPPAAIAKVAAGFFVYVRKDETGYLDHTSTVTLIDPEGRIRVLYGQQLVEEETAMLRDLRAILERKGRF
ncbi:SCO family protein [Deinococcota bacterium DY0809b]